MLWILLVLVFVSSHVLADCYNFTTLADMNDYNYNHPIVSNELRPQPSLNLGEAALGGMIPTSVMVLLIALVRILQIYQRRRNQPLQQAPPAVEPINH